MLQFPSGLGSSVKDRYGNDVQYMMIRIISDEKGSTLRNDSSTGVATESTATATGIGTPTLGPTTPADQDPDLVNLYGASASSTRMEAKKGKVKLDKVIILPMPNNYDVSSKINYGLQDTNLLTKLGDMVNTVGAAQVKELAKIAKNKVIARMVNKAQKSANNSFGVTSPSDENTLSQLLAEEGLAMNPKKEMMYSDFDFRNFSFRYTLAPKNSHESAIVNEIIETFRFYALPELSAGKLFYILPAEFQIEFMLGAKINPNIPRIATSFLTSITVNYSPNSVWASLPDGSALAVDISLNFIENELIDRKRIYSTNNDGTPSIVSGY